MEITQAVLVVLAFMLGALVSWGLPKFIQWRNSDATLKSVIQALCDAAEHLYSEGGQGKDKLKWVLEIAAAYCKQYNIVFNVAEVVAIIDQYVLEVLSAGKAEVK